MNSYMMIVQSIGKDWSWLTWEVLLLVPIAVIVCFIVDWLWGDGK